MHSRQHGTSVGWRQLRAIARDLLEQAPTIDDAEWKARIIDRLLGLGFSYRDQLTLESMRRQMDAASHAFEKRHGPRPHHSPTPPTFRETPGVRPLSSVEALRAIANLETHGLPVTIRTTNSARNPQPNRTLGQIHAWRQEEGIKARVQTQASPEWIQTPKGWVRRRQGRPNSEAPLSGSAKGTGDE